MKAKYSPNSQRIAVTAPNPMAMAAPASRPSGSRISNWQNAATSSPQLTK
jgi:hypothetical protein